MKSWRGRFSGLTLIAALVPLLAKADDFNDSVDAVFYQINAATDPGCSVGVIAGGELIHRSGYGLANLELDVPLDGTQVHRIGSVSKQFTAFAVLLLAEEGKVDLEKDIRVYLPELRRYGYPVSINAVLGHVAGMADYDYVSGGEDGPVEGGLNLTSVAGGPFRLGNEDYLNIQEFFNVVKQIPLRQMPNESYRYSNLGYFLLSMLVEEVSGESLREYAAKQIFEPLGMTSTFFSDDPVEIVKNRASGYRPDARGYVTDMTNLFWVGDGGLHTNIDDLALWDAHFYQPTLGLDPEALMAQFLTPNSSISPAPDTLYANGQNIGRVNGKERIYHSGGWLGVTTFYARYPSEQFSTILLCNDVSLSPSSLSEEIERLYFSSK
ncbi:MAG: penicillin-binding protein [Gammaproteobacteria bacterium]|nr:penicillin-binding protein [Gammaproteobacteria bacterium]